jgi:hypothetical protein
MDGKKKSASFSPTRLHNRHLQLQQQIMPIPDVLVGDEMANTLLSRSTFSTGRMP